MIGWHAVSLEGFSLSKWCWLLILLVPVITRTALCLANRSEMGKKLTEAVKDREGNRGVIIPMAGFTFTALIALAVTDANFGIDLRVPVALLVISFTGFYVAMNVQSYKHTDRADQIGTAAYELGTLGLFVAIANVIVSNTGLGPSKYLAGAALIAWLLDHGIRLRNEWGYYSSRKDMGSSG
jgi:hypothetical protein